MKTLVMIGGAVFGIFNLIPFPWPVRLAWMRFLYFLTVKGTALFPSILNWTKEQNMLYKMGKQKGEEYESIVQLEKVLCYLEAQKISPQQLKQVVDQAENDHTPPEQLGKYIARGLLDPQTAERVLREALSSTRY